MSRSATELTPLNGMILVIDDKKEERHGSIYVPESAESDKMIHGTVLSTSCFMLQDGKYMEPEVKKDDKIVYGKHAGAGNTFDEGGRIYRVLRHNEIWGKFDK